MMGMMVTFCRYLLSLKLKLLLQSFKVNKFTRQKDSERQESVKTSFAVLGPRPLPVDNAC